MNPVASLPSLTTEVPSPEEWWHVLPASAPKAVLVVDLAQSVRLMGADERGTVARWQRFLRLARQVIPANGGRLVKSLGDGLLAEFEDSRDALQTAHLLHSHFETDNESRPVQQHMRLRAGIHTTHRYSDDHDIYGHGVNLAARVAELAQPGSTVVTREVLNTLTEGLDGHFHDMGESELKHWPEAVRTWSVRAPVGGTPALRPLEHRTHWRPSIAVMPFQARTPSPEHMGMGALIADGLIAQLVCNPSVRVVSRWSAQPVPGVTGTANAMAAPTNARFVLGGSYATRSLQVILMAELTDTCQGEVVWADRFGGESRDLMEVRSSLLSDLSLGCTRALRQHAASAANGA